MKSKRKPVVTWAVVDECNWSKGFFGDKRVAERNCFKDEAERVVKLVEHDPGVEELVRATRALIRQDSIGSWDRIEEALARIERKGKR